MVRNSNEINSSCHVHLKQLNSKFPCEGCYSGKMNPEGVSQCWLNVCEDTTWTQQEVLGDPGSILKGLSMAIRGGWTRSRDLDWANGKSIFSALIGGARVDVTSCNPASSGKMIKQMGWETGLTVGYVEQLQGWGLDQLDCVMWLNNFII